ncbi:Conserved hypothetical protein (Lin0512_fam) [Seminavis robusta]|uniref:Uncharacterized protein n=1 Tax=Seminavis robusta TaxID=568900 RepID=A0A9N8HJT4_9STRA|nr:Conserved hypothetical protein (Lin0512_fam) [Seminavis robusta]|eukprot:Sro709_g190960.1 Conserved hypothetical protein (Lin0512_fam) (230) ;mRNA; f:46976-47665
MMLSPRTRQLPLSRQCIRCLVSAGWERNLKVESRPVRRFLSSSTTPKSGLVPVPSKDRPSWSEEWKALGLGASLVDSPKFPHNLLFVQVGFGVDQHGADDATKAAVRAVRNAIEFNSIPGVIEHVPGGRTEMLIHVKLGIPPISSSSDNNECLPVDTLHVAKVFPYGKILPIQIVPGGLDFGTGRVVEELGDTNDKAVCVVACVSIGYGEPDDENGATLHKTYNTKDGY